VTRDALALRQSVAAPRAAGHRVSKHRVSKHRLPGPGVPGQGISNSGVWRQAATGFAQRIKRAARSRVQRTPHEPLRKGLGRHGGTAVSSRPCTILGRCVGGIETQRAHRAGKDKTRARAQQRQRRRKRRWLLARRALAHCFRACKCISVPRGFSPSFARMLCGRRAATMLRWPWSNWSRRCRQTACMHRFVLKLHLVLELQPCIAAACRAACRRSQGVAGQWREMLPRLAPRHVRSRQTRPPRTPCCKARLAIAREYWARRLRQVRLLFGGNAPFARAWFFKPHLPRRP
jgi:hypothetical protein